MTSPSMPTPSWGSPLVRAPQSGAPTIVHLTAEYSPYARSGGLAEAVMGLANVQVRDGANVVVFVPLYRTVRDHAPDLAPLGRPITVSLGFRSEEVRFFREVHAPKGPKVVFVDIPAAFARGGLYGEGGRDYADNARRFALYSRAVLDAIPRLIAGPVLVHAHDWHASLALMYMRSYADLRERFADTPTVLTVHNGGYQGHFPASQLNDCGIPPELFTFRHVEWYGLINFLKAGLTHADMVVTVSPNHATELRTADGGFGLQEVFQWLGNRFTGIVNGIDQTVWNPATDDQITANYSADDPSNKSRCKSALQRSFGLPQRKRTPLFGFTGRMVTQKGLDLVLKSHLVWNLDAQFVFMGAGEAKYERALTALARARPQHVGVQLDFTDRLEHRLMAGADLFLMPSQYEPCGLTQLRAQRYGALPIGRQVGGIADTVEDDATGFLFDEFDAQALDHAISRALARFHDPMAWAPRMKTAMRRDFGWERSAERYAEVYRRAANIARTR
ncbi:glycogen/starch synthase [Gemmatimonas sp.]|uniref:glycogen synthase n=1 Tax=Gemmatimonas sp. TaxID=1962908 RepID=UPI00333F8697